MIPEVTLNSAKVQEILTAIRGIKVCTIGDVCLDLYLYADMRISLLSRETPHYPLPIVKEITSPGGGGNVIRNVCDLGVAELRSVSLLGNDWRGFLLRKTLEDCGVSTEWLLASDSWVTPCYCKPMRMGISDVVYEDPRLDFENRNSMTAEDEDRVIAALRAAIQGCDILVVSDQLRFGVITPRIMDIIGEIAAVLPVVMDSRENSSMITGVIAKPNEVEAAMAVGKVLTEDDLAVEKMAEIGCLLQKKNRCPAIVTLGERGALWCENDTAVLAPTISAKPPIDIVGAGDTFLAAFASAYAAGVSGPEAIAFANLASGVTVKKIGTTGTASPEEILEQQERNNHERV